jgi:hypothetical protein
MSARWIFDYPNLKHPMIAASLVAKWWFRYYWISTVYLGPATAEEHARDQISKSLSEIGARILLPQDERKYVTQVFRCDKTGVEVALDRVLYEQWYTDVEAANVGHKMVVKRFA